VQTFRESDIISRIGGDEFAIMAVNADTDLPDIVMSRFHKFMDYINSRSRQKHKLSMSIGSALFDPAHPCSLDELMSKADIAMYADKKNKNKLRT
jgi:diguanylate cyclase (GGDEF)-like protein